jgi:glycosyltransferase involved in cell wall biosynthesis
MNILLINHYAGSTTLGMEYRPFYLAREWARAGHAVTVVGASWSHLRIRQPDVAHDLTEEIVDGVRYVWLTTPPYSGNGVRRAVNIAVFMAKLVRYRRTLARSARPDVVIASSTYPIDTWPAHRIAASAGATLVYEVHDVWPMSLVELGGMSPGHPFVRVMQWGENYAYRTVDRVVSMLPCTREHMEAHGMDPRKWSYVPNGVDPDEWSSAPADLPDEHAAALGTLRRQGRFIVGYAGSHGIANALESFVDAARPVEDLKVTHVLVGQGPEKAALRARAEAGSIRNVVFLPPVPKAAVPALLAGFDVGFVGWRSQPIARLGVTHNKSYDYLMAGIPILNAVDAGNDFARDSGGGLTVEPESVEAIVAGVRHFVAMTPEERAVLGRLGRAYVLANHTYPVLATRFLEAVAPAGRP